MFLHMLPATPALVWMSWPAAPTASTDHYWLLPITACTYTCTNVFVVHVSLNLSPSSDIPLLNFFYSLFLSLYAYVCMSLLKDMGEEEHKKKKSGVVKIKMTLWRCMKLVTCIDVKWINFSTDLRMHNWICRGKTRRDESRLIILKLR